jgi:hypothetical protein
MKKFFIIFLFTTFGFTLTFAEDNKKITIEEIEHSLIMMNHERNYKRWGIEQKKSKTLIKRIENRKHLYGLCQGDDTAELCNARIIRRIFQRSEQGETRRPGDIFFALAAIENLIFAEKTRTKFVWTSAFFDDGGKCMQWLTEYTDNQFLCSIYSDYTKKKLVKFKKDPSNEKILGKALIKHIKNVRIVKEIKEKIGTDNISLVGDMLNASVKDVVKNEVRKDLKKRRVLLTKYSIMLTKIKNKLDKKEYKSIKKDIANLSKTYKNLQNLNQTSFEPDIKIDEAIEILFEIHKLIESSTLKANNDKEEKILAISTIYFMDSLIDSILSVIPKKYSTIYNKKLDPNLFDQEDLVELETIINTMINKNNIFRSAKMKSSLITVNKYINTSNVLKKLDKLGMKNSLDRSFTQSSALLVANEHIGDSLDKELFKDIKKIVASVEKNGLNDLTKEVSEATKEISRVAKEISSNPSFKSNVTKSYPDPKFGGQSLKALIYMSRQR